MSDEEKPNTDSGAASPPEDSDKKAAAAALPKAKPKPPAARAKKVAARKPVKRGPSYEDLEDDPLLGRLQENFPEGVLGGQRFLGQPIYRIDSESFYDVILYLRDSPDWSFDYLVDVTALDHLGDEKRFELVHHLYSYHTGQFIRLKTRIAEGEVVPSVTSIWKVANWLEREVYDMFGIEFSGHPDLKRILLPEDWIGYPLRKDYDIKLQDQAWIRNHLRIRKTPA